jgi:hypothetical protein
MRALSACACRGETSRRRSVHEPQSLAAGELRRQAVMGVQRDCPGARRPGQPGDDGSSLARRRAHRARSRRPRWWPAPAEVGPANAAAPRCRPLVAASAAELVGRGLEAIARTCAIAPVAENSSEGAPSEAAPGDCSSSTATHAPIAIAKTPTAKAVHPDFQIHPLRRADVRLTAPRARIGPRERSCTAVARTGRRMRTAIIGPRANVSRTVGIRSRRPIRTATHLPLRRINDPHLCRSRSAPYAGASP